MAGRCIGPGISADWYTMLVRPGVYGTIGLPSGKTWSAVKRAPSIVARRHEAIRPIVKVLLDNGVFAPGRLPKPWRRLAGVDARGVPAT